MANITVPGATRQTQPMADRPRLPQDDGFAQIARAAEGVAQNWSQRELQDRADALRRARADAADQFAAVGRELEQDTDFVGMEERYGKSAEAIEVMIGENLPTTVREEFSLEARGLSRSLSDMAGRRSFALRGDHARAELGENLTRYQNLAGGTDDEALREGIFGMWASDAAAAVSAGYITAADAQQMSQGLAQGADLTRAQRRLREDPEGFDPASFGNLSADQRETLTGRKEAELDRRQARAEAEETKRKLSAEEAINEALKTALVGLPLAPEREAELFALADAAGETYGRRMRRTLRDVGLIQRMALMSPGERNEVMRDLLRGGSASPEDTIIFGQVQDVHEKISAAEARAREAALKGLEQERKEAEREARSYRKELLPVAYGAVKDGLPFPLEAARGLFAGTEEEAEFEEIMAMGAAFDEQRATSGDFEAQRDIAAKTRSQVVLSPRQLQHSRDMLEAVQSAQRDLGADLEKRGEEHLEAFSKGIERADFPEFLEEVRRMDLDLARYYNNARTRYVVERHFRSSTAAQLAPYTRAGGASAPETHHGMLVQAMAEEWEAKIQTQERTDPLATLAAQISLSPLDVTDPHSVATRALEARAFTLHLGLDAWGNPREPVLTTKDERAREREKIANLPTSQQAEAWRNAAHAAGPYGATILMELEAPGALVWSAEAEKAGAPVGLLAEAARGVSALAGPPANAPKAPAYEDQRKWTYEVVGDLFSRESSEQARLLEATTAIYAARAGLKQEPDENIWKASLQAALGASGDQGGVRRVAGRLTPLPPGVSAIDAQRGLDGLATRHFEAATGQRLRAPRPIVGETGAISHQYLGHLPEVEATDPEPQPMSTVWGGITSNGEAPLIGGQPVDYNILSGVSLRDMTGGLYALEVEAGGAFYHLEDPATGRALIIDLRKLVRSQ